MHHRFSEVEGWEEKQRGEWSNQISTTNLFEGSYQELVKVLWASEAKVKSKCQLELKKEFNSHEELKNLTKLHYCYPPRLVQHTFHLPLHFDLYDVLEKHLSQKILQYWYLYWKKLTKLWRESWLYLSLIFQVHWEGGVEDKVFSSFLPSKRNRFVINEKEKKSDLGEEGGGILEGWMLLTSVESLAPKGVSFSKFLSLIGDSQSFRNSNGPGENFPSWETKSLTFETKGFMKSSLGEIKSKWRCGQHLDLQFCITCRRDSYHSSSFA